MVGLYSLHNIYFQRLYGLVSIRTKVPISVSWCNSALNMDSNWPNPLPSEAVDLLQKIGSQITSDRKGVVEVEEYGFGLFGNSTARFS